jgi:L-asparaginase
MTARPKICLIYTGGTIGMIKDPHTAALKSFDFDHLDSYIPELDRLNMDLSTFSFPHPIDSSEMDTEKWNLIAQAVADNYDDFDGFVILHGSDTMSYTASALSFMLENLDKPVILTGSQLPIGTIRTDGKENLITAIEIAGAKDKNGVSLVKEVAVYFEYSLYRGNRSSKVSANQFEAFRSPNYPQLAIAGVEISYRLPEYQKQTEEFTVFKSLSSDIGLIQLFPGLNWHFYESIFDTSKVRAIVLETYGSGNAPSDPKMQELVRNFIQEGGIIVNITQCSSGSVDQGKYATSSFFQLADVWSGFDLTAEAATTKLMYLIGKYSSKEKIREEFNKNLRGEMTV